MGKPFIMYPDSESEAKNSCDCGHIQAEVETPTGGPARSSVRRMHRNPRVDEFSAAYDAWAGRQGTQPSGRVSANRSGNPSGAEHLSGTVGGGTRGRPAAAAVRTLLEQARLSAERERAASADYSDMPDLIPVDEWEVRDSESEDDDDGHIIDDFPVDEASHLLPFTWQAPEATLATLPPLELEIAMSRTRADVQARMQQHQHHQQPQPQQQQLPGSRTEQLLGSRPEPLGSAALASAEADVLADWAFQRRRSRGEGGVPASRDSRPFEHAPPGGFFGAPPAPPVSRLSEQLRSSMAQAASRARAEVQAARAAHAETLWMLRREWARARVAARSGGSGDPPPAAAENMDTVRSVAREVLSQLDFRIEALTSRTDNLHVRQAAGHNEDSSLGSLLSLRAQLAAQGDETAIDAEDMSRWVEDRLPTEYLTNSGAAQLNTL